MEPPTDPTMESALEALGVAAESLTATQRRSLDDLGYLILPGAVPAAHLDRLRAAFDRACDLEAIPPQGTRHPKSLLEQEPAFAAYLTHAPLLAAVWQILGRPFVVSAFVGRDPLPGQGAQGPHIDCVDPGPGMPFQVVTALGLIDPFTADNGSTRLVPGSHRFRRPPPKAMAQPASRHPEEIVATAPAGSIVVFNGHLWHSGTLNRSKMHRRSVQYAFLGREQVRPGTALSVSAEFPPAVRFLLGAESC